MNDRPNDRDGTWAEPDPELTSALRSMEPPQHGDGFWDRLDARLAAEPAGPATVTTLQPAVPVPPAPPAPPVPPGPPGGPPPEPLLAEVVPLPAPRRRGPQRWVAAAAAAAVVVLATAALVRDSSTDVRTTTPATSSSLPFETSTVPPTTAPPPSGIAVPTSSTVGPTATAAPATARPGTSRPGTPTSARPTTTTSRRDSLVLSPAGVGPLRLGMSVQQARATGAVAGFFDQSGNGTCGVGYGAGAYQRSDLGALFLDGRLARIYAEEGSRLRTPQGIGIGSPASTLSTVPGTRTEEPHPYGAGTNVLLTEGGVGYLFTVDQGTVRSWSVGTTEGLRLSEACS